MTGRPPSDLVGADLVLLMIAAPDVSGRSGTVNGITRLEKLMFLADKESELPRAVAQPLRFTPYHYGPYSKQIYEAVEVLEHAGLVTETQRNASQVLDTLEEAELGAQDGPEYIERQFSLTNDGAAVAGLLANRNREMASLFESVKARYSQIPLRSLLRYVYRTYPDAAAKSKIRDQFL